ncbi:MAG: hypothetical protein U0531_15440 [Dehalococcoidia bacterium]
MSTRGPLIDMERYFDLFDDRSWLSDLFTVEDARIDYLIRREYGGIRRLLAPAQRRVSRSAPRSSRRCRRVRRW